MLASVSMPDTHRHHPVCGALIWRGTAVSLNLESRDPPTDNPVDIKRPLVACNAACDNKRKTYYSEVLVHSFVKRKGGSVNPRESTPFLSGEVVSGRVKNFLVDRRGQCVCPMFISSNVV